MLEVREVSHNYQQRRWFRRADRTPSVLTDISFTIEKGCCLGLLGTSGAGKSTLGKIILGMQRPSHGQILFEGQDIYRTSRHMSKAMRRDLQVVFQDCYSAVNPMMTAAEIIGEPLDNYERLGTTERRRRIGELLEQVGLSATDAGKRPDQFSGGQLQRINIARAIALKPKLIVLDESVSSLDMVNQTHILSLLAELKASHQLSYLFITHDIRAAMTLCDRIAVMDQGRLVQQEADGEALIHSAHPAVRQLVDSILPEHPANRLVWD